MFIGPINGSDTDGIKTVRVAIKVAIIALTTSVASRKDIDAAKTEAPVLDPIDHGIQYHPFGSIHRLAIIGWPPTTRVDMVLVKVVV